MRSQPRQTRVDGGEGVSSSRHPARCVHARCRRRGRGVDHSQRCGVSYHADCLPDLNHVQHGNRHHRTRGGWLSFPCKAPARGERHRLPRTTLAEDFCTPRCPSTRRETTMNRKRILAVDDDVNATRVLKVGLEKTGVFEVREINRGSDAIAAAKQYRPDAILLDVCMPDTEGSYIAFQLKNEPEFQKTPIIFLTCIVSERELQEKG